MSVEAGSQGTKGGLRVFAPDKSFVQVGPGGSLGHSAVRVVGASGSLKLFMGTNGSTPEYAIANDASGKALLELRDNEGNGELTLTNPDAKIVAVIGSNPVNGQGHAKL